MRKTATTAIVLVLLATLLGSALSAPPNGRMNTPDQKRQPRFSVGPETTRVLGPFYENGSIDYPSALNQQLRQGVTAQTNANVLLWQAFGPHPEGATMPAEFFEWMGIPAPPDQGPYFIDFFKFAMDQLKVDREKQFDELLDEYDRGSARPWKSWQCPRLAAWLKANEKPLALVTQASKRPHYFSPLVVGKQSEGPGQLIAVLIPGVQKCREFANLLTTRAMWHLGEGRYEAAWQDLLTCHRLGRHVGRGGTLIEGLVGLAIDRVACAGDVVFLASTPLNAQRLEHCLRDLQQLPAMPLMADKVDLCERFLFLDMVMAIDHRGVGYFVGLLGSDQMGDLLPKKLPADINWDPALRYGNQWFDRLAAAMRVQERTWREQRFEQIELALKEWKANFWKRETLEPALVGEKSTPETRGQALGEVLMSLLMPAVLKVQHAADRNVQLQRNLHVAFALVAYCSEHGRYPQRLTQLAPRYLAEIPGDLFTGRQLIYLPAEEGFLLYSCGLNGLDDMGRSYDDEPQGDDLAVRLPLPPLPVKQDH
jgi:hypothetical protein